MGLVQGGSATKSDITKDATNNAPAATEEEVFGPSSDEGEKSAASTASAQHNEDSASSDSASSSSDSAKQPAKLASVETPQVSSVNDASQRKRPATKTPIPLGRVCAKMLVSSGHRCPCHYL